MFGIQKLWLFCAKTEPGNQLSIPRTIAQMRRNEIAFKATPIKVQQQAINSIRNNLRLNQYFMGSDQPKSIARVTKAQIDLATLKAKIHLQLFRDRKNAEVIKTQTELVAKIKSKNRNRTEEISIAERVVQGLKYASACNILMAYASNLKLQAQFIAENMLDPKKMQPFLIMIYSLIYAAEQLGLSSLTEFKNLMRALNNPIALEMYVYSEVVRDLAPTPTPEDLNTYMLQFSQRNSIPLCEINAGGHKFIDGQNTTPSTPKSNSFTEIEKRLAEDLKNKFKGPGGFGGTAGLQETGNQGGIGGNKQGFSPYHNIDPRQFPNDNGNNNFSPQMPYNPGNNFSFGPKTRSYDPFIGHKGDTPNKIAANFGPNIYVPPEIAPKNKAQQMKQKISSINEMNYYPEIDAKPGVISKEGFVNPDFDKICERLKKGL